VFGLEGLGSRRDAKTQRVVPNVGGEALAMTGSPPGRETGRLRTTLEAAASSQMPSGRHTAWGHHNRRLVCEIALHLSDPSTYPMRFLAFFAALRETLAFQACASFRGTRWRHQFPGFLREVQSQVWSR